MSPPHAERPRLDSAEFLARKNRLLELMHDLLATPEYAGYANMLLPVLVREDTPPLCVADDGSWQVYHQPELVTPICQAGTDLQTEIQAVLIETGVWRGDDVPNPANCHDLHPHLYEVLLQQFLNAHGYVLFQELITQMEYAIGKASQLLHHIQDAERSRP